MDVKNFNAHKYTVTDCTDKEFVDINITHDEDYNYYMDQTRMITEIIKEANLIIVVFVMSNIDSCKFFVCTVRYCILVRVEVQIGRAHV